MPSIKRSCKRFVVTARSKMGHSFAYQCPVSKVDRKREGRTLVISDGKNAMSFDGFGIRVLKGLLKDSGETGRRVNRRRAKVVVLEPAKSRR